MTEGGAGRPRQEHRDPTARRQDGDERQKQTNQTKPTARSQDRPNQRNSPMKIKLNIAYAMALTLAAIGAGVSLYGLVMMFGITFLPIGLGLEAGKLTSAAALHQSW